MDIYYFVFVKLKISVEQYKLLPMIPTWSDINRNPLQIER